MRLALLATTLAVAAASTTPTLASTAPSAHTARSYRIVTSNGFVTRLGPWRLSDPTLGRATAIFGQPSSTSGGGNVCYLRWRQRRIRAIFVNLGGQIACDPQYGKLQSITIRSPAWRTIGGLRVGNSTDRMRDKYPDATLERGAWTLVSAHYGFGTEDGFIPTVSAVPRNGRVAALTMYVGAAGE